MSSHIRLTSGPAHGAALKGKETLHLMLTLHQPRPCAHGLAETSSLRHRFTARDPEFDKLLDAPVHAQARPGQHLQGHVQLCRAAACG